MHCPSEGAARAVRGSLTHPGSQEPTEEQGWAHIWIILLRGALEVLLTEHHRKMFPKCRVTFSRIISVIFLKIHLSSSGIPSFF